MCIGRFCAEIAFWPRNTQSGARSQLRIACFLLPVFCKERRPFWLAGFSGWLSGISALSVPTNSPKTERRSKPSAIWSTFLHAVYAINNTRPSALDLVMRRSACESGEGMDAGYISQSPGVSLDEGVKQVLSVALPDQSETQTTTSKF